MSVPTPQHAPPSNPPPTSESPRFDLHPFFGSYEGVRRFFRLVFAALPAVYFLRLALTMPGATPLRLGIGLVAAGWATLAFLAAKEHYGWRWWD